MIDSNELFDIIDNEYGFMETYKGLNKKLLSSELYASAQLDGNCIGFALKTKNNSYISICEFEDNTKTSRVEINGNISPVDYEKIFSKYLEAIPKKSTYKLGNQKSRKPITIDAHCINDSTLHEAIKLHDFVENNNTYSKNKSILDMYNYGMSNLSNDVSEINIPCNFKKFTNNSETYPGEIKKKGNQIYLNVKLDGRKLRTTSLRSIFGNESFEVVPYVSKKYNLK